MPGREQRVERGASWKPAVTTSDLLRPSGSAGSRLEVLEQSWFGLPTAGTRSPVSPLASVTRAVTDTRVVGDQRHDRRRRRDLGHLADQALVRDHRVVQAHAVVGAVVDLDRLSTRGSGSRAITLRGDRAGRVEPDAVVEVDQAARAARFCSCGALGLASAARSGSARCACELVDLHLAWSVSADPAGEVAHRLERLARALLRSARAPRPRPAGRCAAGSRRLAEVGGEQDQGDGDEQREDRSPPPDLLVMHVVLSPGEWVVAPACRRAPGHGNLVPTAPVA